MGLILRALSVVAVGAIAFSACTRDRHVEEASMRAENEVVVRGYMETVINQRALNEWSRFFATRVRVGGVEMGPDEFRQIVDYFANGFPDFQMSIEEQIAEGDKVVTRVTFHGTHDGEFEGILPTGKRVEFRGVAIDRIVDGKVVEMLHQIDTWGLIHKLQRKE
jgi:predicted ester cyclase